MSARLCVTWQTCSWVTVHVYHRVTMEFHSFLAHFQHLCFSLTVYPHAPTINPTESRVLLAADSTISTNECKCTEEITQPLVRIQNIALRPCWKSARAGYSKDQLKCMTETWWHLCASGWNGPNTLYCNNTNWRREIREEKTYQMTKENKLQYRFHKLYWWSVPLILWIRTFNHYLVLIKRNAW